MKNLFYIKKLGSTTKSGFIFESELKVIFDRIKADVYNINDLTELKNTIDFEVLFSIFEIGKVLNVYTFEDFYNYINNITYSDATINVAFGIDTEDVSKRYDYNFS